MKKIQIYLFLLFTISMIACTELTSSTTEVSSDATVASLYFTENDSMPGLAAATFIVEEGLDTGRIYNVDSILYGTRVDSVIPVFTFNATPAAAIIYTQDDTIMLSVSDTIDFSHNPTRLQVVASDNQTEKWYNIYVNVHAVDPDLFVWKALATNIYPTVGAEQNAFQLNGTFYIFVNNGITTSLYSSESGQVWTKTTLSGLPSACQVRNIIEANNTLYYADKTQLYTSTNAQEWTAQTISTADIQLVNMLFVFNDSIWAIAQNITTQAYHLATTQDGIQWNIHNPLPANFPISDYAALSFESISRRPRAMVVGGFSVTGESLNTRWNLEYNGEKGYTWTNFSIEQPNFDALTGVDVVWYNERFYMFGGVDANNTIGEYAILESTDEGMHWTVPDSTHNRLPDTYRLRTKASVFVGDDNAIYIVGGQSRTQVFADIYRGKLNSIDW